MKALFHVPQENPLKLHALPRNCEAVITEVHDLDPQDGVARRLREFGFVPGEYVRMVGHGPLGDDPLAVQVGYTRFALRRTEADRVVVSMEQSRSA